MTTTTTKNVRIIDNSAAITQLRGHFTKSTSKTVAQLNADVCWWSEWTVPSQLYDCAHLLAIASTAQRRPAWLTCRRCTDLRSAIHCNLVVPQTRLASYVVSPSLVQRPRTVCRLIFATCLYPLSVSSTNSRLNCSSGHITWDHSSFVIMYYTRGEN